MSKDPLLATFSSDGFEVVSDLRAEHDLSEQQSAFIKGLKTCAEFVLTPFGRDFHSEVLLERVRADRPSSGALDSLC